MRLINHYSPPTAEDLQALKDKLGYSGAQMAELAGVSGNSQWRKYTGKTTQRDMSSHILFYIAAQLALTDDELLRVVRKMQEIGAQTE
ncbi:helix-turn-helix transcriptional regulator [Salmonella enterica]|uniref:helix-turn-helix domain-containing protein n=1 Tax=Enterobacterales TaxID=91347 RepID=UPI00127A0346|nr:helix-turn-helix transcriptional regulator [Salmonella enterica]EAW1667244.1 XRE family transcriptional regulator [Salmonella enterica subsp. enterica]EBO9533165.1 helix-turn-helix transcriptional regulator [Salmonella enterica]EBP0924302.1 helix-turn-helix transcriptional regulator [Salmonella enterica]EBU0956156.1 helix-turn-helix transcriptional regulator [Salmonella enterica]EBU2258189.1 helix-turn-helix transcriptional regulator [Salmonella enterica]